MTAAAIAVLEETLPNDLAAIGAFAERVDAFCEAQDVAMAIAYQLNLAIDELATNVISYGWEDAGPHQLHIKLCRMPDRLTVLMEDDARPFNPLERATPDLDADIDERAIGGLGIHFVRQFATDLAYERVDGRNRLTMEKLL
jgi:anti-sigma regulatory factor (Ser/Thr protein kinase)